MGKVQHLGEAAPESPCRRAASPAPPAWHCTPSAVDGDAFAELLHGVGQFAQRHMLGAGVDPAGEMLCSLAIKTLHEAFEDGAVGGQVAALGKDLDHEQQVVGRARQQQRGVAIGQQRGRAAPQPASSR